MPKRSKRGARVGRVARVAFTVSAALGVALACATVFLSARPAEADERVCGAKNDPCPLQKWMRANMRAAMAANDRPGLARAFDAIAPASPDPAWTWAAIARRGAAAARGGDAEAVKDACRSCHDAYETAYRAKFRLNPAP